MNLNQITEYRSRMRELFVLHQEALISENLPLADKLFDIYCDLTQACRRVDRVLINLYERFVDSPNNLAQQLQAKQIETTSKLAHIRHELNCCEPINGDLRRFIIHLIEYETNLKTLNIDIEANYYPRLIEQISIAIDQRELGSLTSGLETGMSIAFGKANQILTRLTPRLA